MHPTKRRHGLKRCVRKPETVPPLRCAPLRPTTFDPVDYAHAGVSLILCPLSANPTNVVEAGRPLVHESEAFRLYKNPSFKSRITAFDGKQEIPLPIVRETANTRVFSSQLMQSPSVSAKASIRDGLQHYPMEPRSRFLRTNGTE